MNVIVPTMSWLYCTHKTKVIKQNLEVSTTSISQAQAPFSDLMTSTYAGRCRLMSVEPR